MRLKATFPLAVMFVAISFGLNPVTVEAVGVRPYWQFTGGAWVFDATNRNPEAEILSLDNECLSISVTGTEFDFTVTIEETLTVATYEYQLSDLVNCLDNPTLEEVGAADLPQDGKVMAIAEWIDRDGPGGAPKVHPCLQVDASDGHNSDVEAVLDVEMLTSLNATSFGVADIGGGTLADVFGFGMVFLVDASEENSTKTNLRWEFEISVRPCSSGWEGPNIDIEHYRQMAEQAEALPNTR